MVETADSKSSTEASTGPSGCITVGRVGGVHGLRGNLVVRGAGDPATLLGCTSVWLADGEDDPDAAAYEVLAASPGRRGEVRMRLAGVDDREAAEALKGRLVRIDVGELEPLAEGEYYGYQLVGCCVEHPDGAEIGCVTGIWSTGASDLLVVCDERGREQLIPAAAGMLREVDIERRRIVVELPPGLIDED